MEISKQKANNNLKIIVGFWTMFSINFAYGESSNSASASSNSSKVIASATTLPPMPESLRITTVKASSVTLSWSPAPSNSKINFYTIYRDGLALTVQTASINKYIDKSVTENTPYIYGVSAGTTYFQQSAPLEMMVVTPPSIFDSPPIVIIDGDVELHWSKPTECNNGDPLNAADLGGFEIRYKRVDEEEFTSILIEDPNQVTYTIPNLNGEYEFYIASFDVNGWYSTYLKIDPL